MDHKKRVFTVLCIDGGGVRGIVPARVLQEIEERTGKPISELFDLVGGPSTGSIVAAGLVVPDPKDPSKPKFSAEEMKNFYYLQAPKIFPEIMFKSIRQLSSGALYDPKPLEEALGRAFGDAKLKETLTSLMIPATDIKNFRPVWMNHIKGEKDVSAEGWETMLLRDAVRASTTAPTYFPAKYYKTTPNENMPNITHRHALIDGGLFAGNTLHRLLAQARKMAPPDAEIVFVHLGTGAIDNSLSPEEFNKLGPLGLLSKSKGSVLMSLVVNISVSDAVDHIEKEIGTNFVDLDGKMTLDEGPMPLDNATEKNLMRLEKFAEKIIGNHDGEIDRLCEILKTRTMAAAFYQDSEKSFNALKGRLESIKGPRALVKLYRKMVVPGENEPELKKLMDGMTDIHKAQLEKVYQAQLEKVTKQGGLSAVFKEASDDIGDFFRKLGVKDNDDTTPPVNDNKPDDKQVPPAKAQDSKKKRPKWGFGT